MWTPCISLHPGTRQVQKLCRYGQLRWHDAAGMAIARLLQKQERPPKDQQAAPASGDHARSGAADDLRCGLFSLSSAIANRPGAHVMQLEATVTVV